MRASILTLTIAASALPAAATLIDGYVESAGPNFGSSSTLAAEVQLSPVMVAGDETEYTLRVHWTSEFGIDWCMYLWFSTPDFTLYGGNIFGSICGAGSWAPTSIGVEGGIYTANWVYYGSESCADTFCISGSVEGSQIPGAEYGWNGGCDSFPADGLISGCP